MCPPTQDPLGLRLLLPTFLGGALPVRPTEHLAAGPFYSGPIYVSTNSGDAWAPTESPSATFWWAIASSADGAVLVALSDGASGHGVYISTNSGNSWNKVNWLSASQSVALSADGKTLVVGAGGGLIYSSCDSGTTWTTSSPPSENWWAIASSADGSKLAAGVWNGGIYTLQTTPAPSLSIALTNGSLALSWFVPSADFYSAAKSGSVQLDGFAKHAGAESHEFTRRGRVASAQG